MPELAALWRRSAPAGALVVITTLVGCDSAPPTTLIENVVIVDGTGAPAYSGAVRILDDHIVEVGQEIAHAPNETVVDGGGRVLAPGFIDTHSHHDGGLSEMRDALAAVNQGITTIVVGQDGGSHADLAPFLSDLEAAPAAVNLATYSGHGTLRYRVMGDDLRRTATQAEVDSMAILLRQDMEAGALGLSTGLEYAAAFESSTEEVIQLASVAAEYGGRYMSHIRSEDRTFWAAIDEIIRIGDEADIPVQVAHMKLAMTSLWGRTDELIAKLDSARAAGVDITADVYPWTYWQSTMTVLVPDGNFTRAAVAFALQEVATPDGIIFGRFTPEPSYSGRTLEEIAEERGEDAVTTYLALLEMVYGDQAPDDAGESIVARSMVEEDIGKLYQWAHTNVCTDGGLAGPHPRGYASFPRVLRRYVREEGMLTLEDAVHRMTQMSAQHLGMQNRGVIAEGMWADLVLFDPETVSDHATFESPHELSTGIEGVWVNGVRVWGADATSGAYPGRVIRRGDG